LSLLNHQFTFAHHPTLLVLAFQGAFVGYLALEAVTELSGIFQLLIPNAAWQTRKVLFIVRLILHAEVWHVVFCFLKLDQQCHRKLFLIGGLKTRAEATSIFQNIYPFPQGSCSSPPPPVATALINILSVKHFNITLLFPIIILPNESNQDGGMGGCGMGGCNTPKKSLERGPNFPRGGRRMQELRNVLNILKN
jgi:hypothetical protein